MSYRGFVKPAFATGKHGVSDWMTWLQAENVIPSVASRVEGTCSVCFGAVTLAQDGTPWPHCWNCRTYGDAIDGVVPMVYSMDSGLESILHRFKDWAANGMIDYTWLKEPLASFAYTFWSEHEACITREFGGFDLTIEMPSDNPARTFSQIQVINTAIPNTTIFPIQGGILERNPAVTRPARAELKPEAYNVIDTNVVNGANILLIDDTWTSGSSTASAGEQLKYAGAHSVVVLTLGRQLNANHNYGTTAEIVEEVNERGWTGECVCCD